VTELLERLAADVGGRYVVERELGRGGMATVYLARDLLDERRVAIKVMDPELSAAVGAERFKREIAVASRLEHPHILGIIASGEAAGTSYYVMPFVQGESLRDRLNREKQLPMEDAIRIAREVADALAYAHQQGVIHRDIKPENILLEDGRALVADFGIARAATSEENSTLTKTGTALGTPHYMSPEQVMGEKKDIDGRTDQYALGCMLYEMLAGQPPFTGPHAQSLMAQHVLDDPPFVTRFRTSTPANVEDAILTTLAKQKQDRFPTMNDFTVALENTGFTSLMVAARKQRDTQVQMPALTPRMPVWQRAAIAAAGLVLLVGGTAGAWNYIGKSRGDNVALRAEMKRIAVLYFEPDGGGDLPALADGLTEGVIARLRGVRALTVASPSSVARFRGRTVRDSTIPTQLNVGVVAGGQLRREGDEFVVAVRLYDRSGGTLENFTVRHPTSAAFTMRDSVAERVSRQLREYVGKEAELGVSRAGTTNAQAWTLLQRGSRARYDADSLARAEQVAASMARLDAADGYFREAAALDGRWSAPLVGLASTALARANTVGRGNRKLSAPWLDSAETLATRALGVDAEDADAFAVRGEARARRLLNDLVPAAELEPRFAQAAGDLDTATTLEPAQAAAWNMRGELEYAMRRPEEAKRYTLQAYQADAWLAEAPSILWRLFITSHDLNSYDDARKYCNEGALRFPGNPRFIYCRLFVQMMPNAQGVTTAASVWRVVDSLEKSVPPERWAGWHNEIEMFAAAGLVRAGLADSALRVVVRARPGSAKDDPNDELLGLEAFVRAQAGDKETAIGMLERYVGEHPQHIVGFKRGDFWWWRPLKDDPRYQRILKQANEQ